MATENNIVLFIEVLKMIICPAEKAYTSTVLTGARINQFGYLCPVPVFKADIPKKSWS